MTYVMSDIHGNFDRFISVMDKINLQSNDELYILGDVIDRYPQGIEILRCRIIKESNIHMLLGNHELMMYKSLCSCDEDNSEFVGQRNRMIDVWYKNGGDVTHEAYSLLSKHDKDEILEYIESLPLNIEISVNGRNFLLAHSAPSHYFHSRMNYSKLKNEKEFCTWYRILKSDPVPDGYTLIFGHTPTSFYNTELTDKESLKVYFGENKIGIDCGSAYSSAGPLKGRLACIRLDDMKVFYSTENYDDKTRASFKYL